MSSPLHEISNGSSSGGCPPYQPSGPHPWGLAAMLLLSGSCKQESYIAPVPHLWCEQSGVAADWHRGAGIWNMHLPLHQSNSSSLTFGCAYVIYVAASISESEHFVLACSASLLDYCTKLYLITDDWVVAAIFATQSYLTIMTCTFSTLSGSLALTCCVVCLPASSVTIVSWGHAHGAPTKICPVIVCMSFLLFKHFNIHSGKRTKLYPRETELTRCSWADKIQLDWQNSRQSWKGCSRAECVQRSWQGALGTVAAKLTVCSRAELENRSCPDKLQPSWQIDAELITLQLEQWTYRWRAGLTDYSQADKTSPTTAAGLSR